VQAANGYPGEERMREVFDLVSAAIERRWGIPVTISDVVDPFTGDLDGAEIQIDHDLTVEDALFILVHLFGHTVQWNVDPRARELDTQPNPNEEQLAALRDYEVVACRYSIRLLHDCGIHDFDQWLADFAECDFQYLAHFYRTGEKREFRSFWRAGQPLLPALDVPHFTPTRWTARWGGVVV
jgi:hypothetical protein